MQQDHAELVLAGSKQDAVLWDAPEGRIFNVHREEDWRFIRGSKPILKCPVRTCDVKLVAVDRKGTRHFRNSPGSVDCRHFTARPDDHSTRGGGPMSPEHLWYQREIAKQAQKRPDMRVIIEDFESNADVLITNTTTNRSIAVEIQRWDTDIEERTARRMSLGHEVIWLITDSAQLTPEMKHRVFTSRGAFVRVRSFDLPHRTLAPWDGEPPRSIPVMEVSGTAARLDTQTGKIRSVRMPLMKVLDEILDGKREWMFPGETIYKTVSGAGRKGGAWARNIDYVNALILSSGLDIPLAPETSRYGRLSEPVDRPPYYPEIFEID